MGLDLSSAPRHARAVRAAILVAIALGALLALPVMASAAPITIDVTNDANQSPVFATFTDPTLASPAVWNEFKWVNRDYPLLGGHTSNKSLPVVHVFAPVPNGRYQVFANLYGQPSNVFRYYYSYASGDPSALSVDVGPQADCAEIQLETVEVVDGQFDIYFQKADATSGPENYFGWAWVRLVPIEPPVVSTPASSAWSLWLLAGTAAIITIRRVRRAAA